MGRMRPHRVSRSARLCAALLSGLFLPFFTLAAEQSLASTTPEQNAYRAGADVVINAPLPADLLAAAGTLQIQAPVAGDGLIAAGSLIVSAPVEGDLRAAGARVQVTGDIGGELAVFGANISVTGKAKEIRAAGGTIAITGGSAGPVTVYGANVTLAGEFAGDVRVVASDHVTLGEGTVIHGAFEYNAPQEAGIPASATVAGGVSYIGSSSFLPTAAEAKTFALAGVGIFFLVRLVAALLAVGLLTGLFPEFARRVAEEALVRSGKRVITLMLIGIGVIVLTPVLIVFLLASFVGIGLAALVGASYILLLLLSYAYAAVIAGATLMRLIFKRRDVPWKGAVLGMALLYVLGLVPGLGLVITFILSAIALGSLVSLFYKFAFNRSSL